VVRLRYSNNLNKELTVLIFVLCLDCRRKIVPMAELNVGRQAANSSRQMLKFIYSEKATKFCEIFTLLLTGTTWDKSKVKISQNFVAFSEYMNFSVKMVVEFEELRTCCGFLTTIFPKIMSRDIN
jgi:hypothetical protein